MAIANQYWVVYSYGGAPMAWVTILTDGGIASGLEPRLGVPAPLYATGYGYVVVAWASPAQADATFPLFATFFADDIQAHFMAHVRPDFGVVAPSDNGDALVAMWSGGYGFGGYYVPFPE